MERIKPYVKLVSISPNILETIRWAADVSKIRIGDDPVKYCEQFSREELEDFFLMMLKEQFGTPLEYIQTVWYLDNVSRAAQQQITRHRQASYSIESMRVVPKENFAQKMLYHVPDNIENDPEKRERFHEAMTQIETRYNALIQSGVNPEDARGILPLNVFSTITMAMNLRSLTHMIFSRTCNKAQGEVHDIAVMMMDELRPYLGDRVVDQIDRPCKCLKKCFMPLENTQALQGKTTRPLCKYFPEYLKATGQDIDEIRKWGQT